MKKQLLLPTFFILCLTLTTYAQLDSVFYQGPAAGSVPSGVMVTLGQFTFDEPVTGTKIADRIVEEPYFDPRPADLTPVDFPGYVYVEDTQVKNSVAGSTGQTVVLDKWDGIPMTNSIPPDPHVAVGPLL